MERRPRWRDYLAYLAVRLVSMLFNMFPIEWNLRTARLIGWTWFRLPGRLGRHRERAMEHVRIAYGDTLSDDARRGMVLESMQHLVMLAVEVLQTPRLITLNTWARYVKLVDLGAATRVLLDRRGCILLTAHYGSFELLGYTLATVGFPIVALMRPFDNEYLNSYLLDRRMRSGLRLLYKKGAIERAHEVLAEGNALCFIADQDAGRKGLFVDFFGRPASTYKSIGLLAMEYKVPVVVGCARRIGRGFRYEIHVNRIIHPHEWQSQADELRWITQEFSRAMEDFIRVAPEQYLWIHRRWKHEPRKREPAESRLAHSPDTAIGS